MIFSSVLGKFARFSRIAAGVIVSDFLQIVAPAQKIPTVLGVQVDATLDPGASPADRDAYILTNTAALHANFGSITGVGDNDIVMYKSGAFRIVFDASVSDANDRIETFDVSTDTKYRFSGGWSRDELGSMALQNAGSGPTEYRDNAAQDVAIGTEVTNQISFTLSNLTRRGGRNFQAINNPSASFFPQVGTEYFVGSITGANQTASRFKLPPSGTEGDKIWLVQKNDAVSFYSIEIDGVGPDILFVDQAAYTVISSLFFRSICFTFHDDGMATHWIASNKEDFL